MSTETLLIIIVLVLLLGGGGVFYSRRGPMNGFNPIPITKFPPHSATVSGVPVREADAELAPKAEAKAANKLPPTEQLKMFEKDLEARDSGNQPA